MKTPLDRTQAPNTHLDISRRQVLGSMVGLSCAGAFGLPAFAAAASPADWAELVRTARGQKVYFNAWGGSDRINAYIGWAARELKAQFGIELIHVKVSDIAQTVARVIQELERGKTQGGSVDMLWLNGENFARLKRQSALLGPFTAKLPNMRLVDTAGKPTTLVDFGEPTDGLEAPWGMAQLSFFADSQRLPSAPKTVGEWLSRARANPGQLTYPQPPDFHGTTWLKQWLMALAPNPAAVHQPWTSAAFDAATEPLWKYLDVLHPHLWRSGQQFPQNAAAIRQGVADQSLLIGITFNPNEAASEIAAGRLPRTVRTFQLSGGTIANTHFLAIPKNATSPAAAQVAINFLLSPNAQARKADIGIWGDPTVLDLAALSPAEQAAFPTRNAPGALLDPQPPLPEPHASWVQPLENAWRARYAR